jgi:hypothetical protein
MNMDYFDIGREVAKIANRERSRLAVELEVLNAISKAEGVAYAATDVIKAGGVEQAFPRVWVRYLSVFIKAIRKAQDAEASNGQ